MIKRIMNKKLLKNQKGLTLIEVLAVVVILAIVAIIAIPAIGNIIDNSRIKSAKADAVNLINAAHLYYTDGGEGKFDDSKKEYFDTSGGADDGWFVTKSTTAGVAALEFSGKVVRGNISIDFAKATIDDIRPDTTVGSDTVKITKK